LQRQRGELRLGMPIRDENFYIRLRFTKQDGLKTVLHWLHIRPSQETRLS